jgi:glycosyltransferase involved in cell wall biosynthesis
MKLSALLIVKNEESIVATALESVKDFDEIVVVDTGSTDATLDIVKRYTDTIYHFPWVDDFAAARNFAIEKATGDWCFSIDADHKLVTPIAEVRSAVEKADAEGQTGLFIKAIQGKHTHWGSTLFKRTPEVKWVGKVHEYLSPRPTAYSEVTKEIGYSKNHALDPDRNIRILQSGELTTRGRFYLGREYYERKRYDEAIAMLHEYLKDDTWDAERAEAYLTLARCYWFTNRGDEAREHCLRAIQINPAFKEALLFMGGMHYEPRKSRWLALAEVASNEDVLFVRT